MVQVPPRGVWRKSGAVRFAALDAWVGRPLPTTADRDEIVLRYLGAFGPASVKDAQSWSGVTRLGEVFERLSPRLRSFRDEAGRELFDLPDAPRPDPDTPAPVRFLADFDNLLLSHADRSRFISDEDRRTMTYAQGPFPGMLMVDGSACGQWHLVREAGAVTMILRLARKLSAEDEAAVRAEADVMLRFYLPNAEARTIQLAGYDRRD
jgi:hypothetical protein